MCEKMINWGTIIISIISFLLGLLGNLFIQWWADKKRLSRIKGALKLHLRDIILKESKILRSEFEKIMHHIQNAGRSPMTFRSCKTFDAEIYKANNPSDYYRIYGENDNKFDKLVSTYAIIAYLKENMPSKIYSNYLSEVNEHLYSNISQGISINQQFKESTLCQNLRINYVTICENLTGEVDTLTSLIKEFIE